MKINVASKNPVKVAAVSELVKYYGILRGADVVSFPVPSNVSSQPRSLEETLRGAMNRARAAFSSCKYSFGIESGFMAVPNTKTGYMNVTSCAIYDGRSYSIGLSSAFECPPKVTRMIFEEGVELDEAYHRTGLTSSKRIGYAEGAISALTKGRLNRKDYTKEAVRMALIHLENGKLYKA